MLPVPLSNAGTSVMVNVLVTDTITTSYMAQAGGEQPQAEYWGRRCGLAP